MFSLHGAVCSLLTLQPHTSRLQATTSRQTIPDERTMDSVHPTRVAIIVPKSAAVTHCTVSSWPPVVFAVIRGKHHAVVVVKCIFAEPAAGVTRVPRHLQRVVVCLRQYSKRTVLGPVPVVAVTTWLQVEPQLIAVVYCQLTEQFVAEPVVAAWVAKTDFELRPRTIEEVVLVDFPLDQQRDAVGYMTFNNINRLKAAHFAVWHWISL